MYSNTYINMATFSYQLEAGPTVKEGQSQIQNVLNRHP